MLKNLIKQILTNTGPKLFIKKKIEKKLPYLSNINLRSYGKKNPNKIFYVIRRSPGAGLFSNLTYVLNHLVVANKHNFIPVVDMENYPTIYNEKNKVNGTKNSWLYYFKPVSKYKLSEIYQSFNVIISGNSLEESMSADIASKAIFKKTLKKYIKFNNKLDNEIDFYKKKYFSFNDKILGVHFRGTTYKTARGHAFPLTKNMMKKNIDSLIKKYKYSKIFIITEEVEYLNFLKKKYKNKIIHSNFFRSKTLDAFQHYPRKDHRYNLGKEIIIETMLLSFCDGLTFVKSNVSSSAILFSKKKQKLHEIFLGYNSRNKYIARWLWYFKSLLPKHLGGLKIYKYNQFMK